MVICAIGAYVATAAEAALGSASWLDAAQVGTSIWLLAHGGVMEFSQAQISVLPWGIAMIAILLLRSTVRRSHVDTPWALAWTLGGYLMVQALLTILSGNNSWAALLGSVLVVTIGALWGIRKDWAWPEKLSAHTPSWVSTGMKSSALLALILLGIATLGTIGSLITHHAEALEVHDALTSDPISAALLVIAQIILLGPVLIGWALSFFSGVGFSVGEGTLFSPGIVESGPLPAVPILAALPAEVPPLLSTWLVILLIMTGGALGFSIHRYRFTLLRALGAVLIMVALSSVAIAIIIAASSGSVGPGTMSITGAGALQVAWHLAWKIFVGASLTILVAHPTTHQRVKQFATWLGVWWREMRGTNQVSSA